MICHLPPSHPPYGIQYTSVCNPDSDPNLVTKWDYLGYEYNHTYFEYYRCHSFGITYWHIANIKCWEELLVEDEALHVLAFAICVGDIIPGVTSIAKRANTDAIEKAN
jgi:fructose-1,6-bisphosphatase/sedoheptulose 1,7-bisphosphatase-like protein